MLSRVFALFVFRLGLFALMICISLHVFVSNIAFNNLKARCIASSVHNCRHKSAIVMQNVSRLQQWIKRRWRRRWQQSSFGCCRHLIISFFFTFSAPLYPSTSCWKIENIEMFSVILSIPFYVLSLVCSFHCLLSIENTFSPMNPG